MKTTTERISDYIAGAVFQDLPGEVVKIAKQHILDSVSNMIGGQRLEASKIVMRLFSEFKGAPQATVLASGSKLPLLHAIYVNSYLGNVLDYDDNYLGEGFGGHPGSAIIPPALAVAEQLEAPGKELITSVVIGYEVALHVGAAIAPTKARGVQVLPLATWQSLGAAAAAAKLLHLDREETRNALGLAGVTVPVPSGRKWGEAKDEEGPVSWAKNNFGWASMGAVLGPLLAKRGFLGNRQVFDGDHGFWIMAGSDRCEFDKLVAGLGEDYMLLKAGIKKYPACWWAQSALEAVDELEKESLAVDEIREINLMIFHEAVENLSNFSPKNPVDVQFSLPYLIALKLSKHSLLNVSEEVLLDNRVQSLARKVHIREGKDAEESYPQKTRTTVCVKLEGKQALCKTVEIPKGDFRRPLGLDELEMKCIGLLAPFFSRERSKRIIKDVSHIEDSGNIRTMISGWYSS